MRKSKRKTVPISRGKPKTFAQDKWPKLVKRPIKNNLVI